MNYKISAPIIVENIERQGRDELLLKLRELNAERVFLAIGCYNTDSVKKEKMIEALKDNCEFFHSQGFEVGVWLWAFMFTEPTRYTPMVMVRQNKEISPLDACPTDEDFLRFSGEYLQDLARCGVDMIMFDDDLRFGHKPNGAMGCLCENHMKRICERLGETISREELVERILEKPNNKYRDAWLAENGRSMEDFARSSRRYVDKVDATVRIGFCACMNIWDLDGTDAMTMAKLFAGNTRPFIRLIGAPYWAVNNSWGNTLQDVVELERMESSWLGREDIEIMAEGDSYPRPRIACPAAYLEGFDTAIRAAGCTDGILKYAIDYTSSANYENGYVEYHKRNRSLYEEIHAAFDGKTPCGIRVYEEKRKIAGADVSKEAKPDRALQYLFFSNAARLLAANAIPTTYEGKGVCGIAFGENVKYLSAEERRGGLIIDGSAAGFLHEMGVDVGIETLGEKVVPSAEWFFDYGELITTFGIKVYDNSFKKNIRILSEGRTDCGISLLDGDMKQGTVVMSYLYENSDGERYLVINVDARIASKENNDALFKRQYFRGKQIADTVPWLSGGRALPAFCGGNPCLYAIAKKGDGKLSVGLWNFYADPIWEPWVDVDEEYTDIKVLGGGQGIIEGNKVRLGEIAPFGFAGFELSK